MNIGVRFVRQDKAQSRWVPHKNGNSYCSVCGAKTLYKKLRRSRFYEGDTVPMKSRFCHNCGAAMEKKNQDAAPSETGRTTEQLLSDILEQYMQNMNRIDDECNQNVKGAVSMEAEQFFMEEFYKKYQNIMAQTIGSILTITSQSRKDENHEETD